jgi:SAM-dependent methyltransferase
VTEGKRRLLAARAMSDVAAAQTAIVVRLADTLHVFKELQGRGAMSADEVAQACDVRPVLAAHMLMTLAASDYVDFDAATKRYSLSPEQVSLFANEEAPLFLAGAFQLAVGLARQDEHEIAEGIDRSSRAKFPPLLVRRLGQRFELGQFIAEIGCGSGGTLIEIARRYPKVRAIGIDRSDAAIARARVAATHAGVDERVQFVVGNESQLTAGSCDVALSLEVLHELSNPVEAALAAFHALRAGGVWFLVEPCADRIGPGNDVRFLASLACLYCLPAADFAPDALGPLVDRQTYDRVVRAGGFEDVSIEDDGPIHLVIEARR